ncbi:MAG: hypothetical protein PHC75_00330 [Burkholderiales bacterium]|nr:hypothetical protein [Burkholderiales bacterium]
MRKILITLCAAIPFLTSGCNNGNSTISNNTATVSALTLDQMNTDNIQECFNNSDDLVSNPTAINSNGIVTGFVPSGNNCVHHGYIWGQQKSNFVTLPNPIEGIDNFYSSAISDNIVTAGYTDFHSNRFGGYVMNNIGHPLGGTFSSLSANGIYITFNNGENFASGILNVSTNEKTIIDNNIVNNEQSLLYSVSNNGTSVGVTMDDGNFYPIICHENQCSEINNFDKSELSGGLVAISSNSNYIYGQYTIGDDDNNQLFSVNPQTQDMANINLPVGFFIRENTIVTDEGVTIVEDRRGDNDIREYVFIPQTNQIYSVHAIIEKLGLQQTIDEASLSPNGKYMIIKTYGYNALAYKIYFSNGIANWLAANINQTQPQ